MTIADKLLLGIDTTMNGMGIVFIVLIVLWAVIVAQSKLLSFFTERLKKPEKVNSIVKVDKVVSDKVTSNKVVSDIIAADKVLSDIIDDETQAIVMAVVSNYENIPISKLQFKSIKAL